MAVCDLTANNTNAYFIIHYTAVPTCCGDCFSEDIVQLYCNRPTNHARTTTVIKISHGL